MGRGVLALFCLVFASNAFSWVEGGRECSQSEFPSTVRILISIKDKSGQEVWNGICSGTVVDLRMVLTDSHCFLQKPQDGELPEAILERYFKEPGSLRTEYEVEGKNARLAFAMSHARQGMLIFDQPLVAPTAEIARDSTMDQGRICQLTGYSPAEDMKGREAELKSRKADGEPKTFEELLKTAKARRQLFEKVSKRCGQTRSEGVRLSENSDISLFAGISGGFSSSQNGDSGGGCYVMEDGVWKLAGILEFGEVKVVRGPDGKAKDVFDANPRNNGIVVFEKSNREALEELFSHARKLRDRDKAFSKGLFGTDTHRTFIRPWK